MKINITQLLFLLYFYRFPKKNEFSFLKICLKFIICICQVENILTDNAKIRTEVAEKASWDQTNREKIFGLKNQKKRNTVWLIVNDL